MVLNVRVRLWVNVVGESEDVLVLFFNDTATTEIYTE